MARDRCLASPGQAVAHDDLGRRRAAAVSSRVQVEGDPSVSVCHCLACQRRTGSAFGVQARWPIASAQITGESHEHLRISDDGDEERRFHFCPECGGTVYYFTDAERIAIPVGLGGSQLSPNRRSRSGSRAGTPWVTMPAGPSLTTTTVCR